MTRRFHTLMTLIVDKKFKTMSAQSHSILLTIGIALGSLSLGTYAEATPSPCSILTTAEVEQVIGKLMAAPKADQEGSAAWCNYEFANGLDAMEVWVFPADGIERGRRKAKHPIAVKGLGNDAFFDRGMHGLNYVNLFIRKGNVTIQISLKEMAGDEDKIKTLGKHAVERF